MNAGNRGQNWPVYSYLHSGNIGRYSVWYISSSMLEKVDNTGKYLSSSMLGTVDNTGRYISSSMLGTVDNTG